MSKTKPGKKKKSKLKRAFFILIVLIVIAVVVYPFIFYHFVAINGSEALLIVKKNPPSFKNTFLSTDDLATQIAKASESDILEESIMPANLSKLLIKKIIDVEPGTYPPDDYQTIIVNNIKNIQEKEKDYHEENGIYGTLADLIDNMGGFPLIDENFGNKPVAGYNFNIKLTVDNETEKTGYILTAKPAVDKKKHYFYYADETGLITCKMGETASNEDEKVE